MSITFTKNPIPVVTPLGNGYVLYVKSNGMLENDEWAVALEDDGQVRHFLTSDIKIFNNATYNINKDEEINFYRSSGTVYDSGSTFTNSTAEDR